MHAMETLWADRINSTSTSTFEEYDEDHDELGQHSQVNQNMIDGFLSETMGVTDQIRMSTDELYEDLGGERDKQGHFVGLHGMNLSTPTNGWYILSAIHDRRDIFEAQMAANDNVRNGDPIENPDFIPLQLRWHQIVAIHRLLSHVSSQPSNAEEFQPRDWVSPLGKEDLRHHREGILIADEVGVGKSAQVLGFIAQIMHWKELERKGKPFPPVHSKSYAY
jgi:hypothetical protein